MLKIDRVYIKKAFAEYTDKYDSNDGKIKLKIDHTYRVADFCDCIAESLCLNDDDKDLAWAIGMLHDIGRFEQVKRFGTFMDADSVDHAQFGADLLFDENLIQMFLPESKTVMGKDSDAELHLMELAIREHNKLKIRERISKREELFCNIIRDADKIDILRVNVETPIEVIYNVSTEELRSAAVADAVMKNFYEEHCIPRSLRESAVDNIVGHVSLVYELIFPISLKLVKEQGYLEQLMNFPSDNEKTLLQFEEIRAKMHRYIKERV